MKIRNKFGNVVCIIIVVIVIYIFISLGKFIKEGFLPDYSDYNTVDRINTTGNKYSYCIGGKVSCSGNMTKVNDNYKGGTTYTCDNSFKCNNFVSDTLDISGDKYLWNTPNGVSFPFSTVYSGFTVPSSYIPVELNGNLYNIYDKNNNIIDSMNKCDVTNNTYRCKMATHSIDSTFDYGDAKFVDSSFGQIDISYNDGQITNTTPETIDVYHDYAEKGCIADYGSQIGDNVCNGEFGLLEDTAYVCPYYKPICDFQCGTSLGKCDYKDKIAKDTK